ncbi:MAG: VCBS repeat-containing protein [Deltaproteobacteria bacterium]|nr:VCBS repeat-containing protein [Deltaproteobacteria bacterium]
MLRALGPVVLSLTLGGCLSIPDPRGAGDGGDAGVVVDGGDGGVADAGDGGARPCTPSAPGIGTPFAPSPARVRAHGVADFNCDGKDDLIVLNVPGEPLAQGIFLMLGRPLGAGAIFDAFVATGATRPMVVLAEDFTGDGLLDLLVFGGEDTGGPDGESDQGVLLAFTATTPTTFSASGRVVFDPVAFPRFEPVSFLPSSMARAQLDDDAALELVVLDYDGIVTADVTTFSPLALGNVTALPLPMGLVDSWRAEAAQPFPSALAPGRQDLLVITQYEVVVLRNGATGLTPAGVVPVPPTAATSGFQGAFFTNLDNGTMPDAVGAGGNGAGAILFEGQSSTRLDWSYLGAGTLQLSDPYANWIQLGHTGGGAAPDLVVLDRDMSRNLLPAELQIYRDLAPAAGPASIRPTSFSARRYSGSEPRDPDSFVIGNFDGVGAPEIVGFEDSDGTAACVRDTGTALEPCPTGL